MHPCFRNFNSITCTPVDVIRVKFFKVNSFLDPMCVPLRISINKLGLVPDWMVAWLVDVFRNDGGLGTGEPYIPVMSFDPLLYGSHCFPDVDFAAFPRNPVDSTILFSQVDGVISLQKCHVRWSEYLVLGTGGETPILSS